MNQKSYRIFILIILTAVLLISCNNNGTGGDNTDNGEQNGENNGNVPPVKVPVPASVCYTANESGSISVIDLKTNKVVNSIKTDGVTHNVQVSPDGNILAATVAANEMDMNGKVLFYNTDNNELINQTEVGKNPAHVDFTQNGKYAVVANNGDNTVSVIDMSSYKVTETIETGKGPHGLRIASDNTFAFVANMGEDSISIISLVNFSQLNKRTLGKMPVTTAIAPDGVTVMATLNGEDVLAIYDTGSGKIDKISVGKGPAQVFIQSDEKYAFVANEGTEESPSNTVSKVNLETKTVEATIEVGKGAHGVVVSDDDKYVYVTNIYDDTVSVIDNATNKVIATIPVDEGPNGVTLK
jgi:YVTN family beta-propeller protein